MSFTPSFVPHGFHVCKGSHAHMREIYQKHTVLSARTLPPVLSAWLMPTFHRGGLLKGKTYSVNSLGVALPPRCSVMCESLS